MDKDVVQLASKTRQEPRWLISHLEDRLTKFNGKIMKRVGKPDLMTHEGEAAVRECIQFLQKAEPVCALEWSDDLAAVAMAHALD